MIGWLRSIGFTACNLSATVVLALVMIPTLLLPRRAAMPALGRVWAAMVNGLVRAIIGSTIEFRGVENLPDGATLVAVKHQSAWETSALLGILPDACFILKKELQLIPVFGWYLMKNRQVAVDRGAGAKALKSLLRGARAAAEAGRQIVIFPEGTRVAPGDTRDYQPGVAALYKALDLVVVPVALNSGVAWGRRRFIKRPSPIIVEFGEPIPPGLERKVFMALLHAAIEPATRRLEAEAWAALNACKRDPSDGA
ncbi:MAG: lysophospholipid acyltransferase family protein [Alphaproteobacteria bacterium]